MPATSGFWLKIAWRGSKTGKKIGGAGLDVFENEPTPRMDLVSHSKVSATPHIGAATVEAQTRIGTELAETIISHFGQR